MLRRGVGSDGVLDLLAPGGQRPGVGRPLGLAPPLVADQAEALQAREELGDLPLVGDPGGRGDLAVAGPGCPAIAISTRTVR